MKPPIHHQAFTATELLLAIVGIGILTALLFPATKSVLDRSRSIQCVQNLRSLAVAVAEYAADHQQSIPLSRTNTQSGSIWYFELYPYLPSAGFGVKKPPYHCPANPYQTTNSGAAGHTNYSINANLYIVNGRAGGDDPDYLLNRRTYRLNQITKPKALFSDSVNASGTGTWYVDHGARHSNPWVNTYPVHGDRVNIVFTDGHIQSPRVFPRIPDPRVTRGDLNELKAEWYWPITN